MKRMEKSTKGPNAGIRGQNDNVLGGKTMRKSKISIGIAVVMLSALALSGCQGKETGTDSANVSSDAQTDTQEQPQAGEEAPEEEQTYTVTFYDTDGTTVLSTEEVKGGDTVTEYTPEKENQIFMGWFATPTLAHEFDFTQAVTQDTDVFAGFMENIEDTRTFAILGSGTSPLLAVSNWGKTINDEHYMTKTEGENTYTITVDLCEGDEFQFAIDTSWNNQRGGGYMLNTGIDGTEYFAVSGGLSESSQKSNIKCVKEGNYTFTLKTYPGADVYDTKNSYYTEDTKENYNSNPYDTIEWTYNGEASTQMADAEVSYFIKGAIITGWEDKYDAQYGLVEKDGVHSLTIDLEEGDEFLLTSLITVDGNSNVGNEYVRYSNVTDETSLSYVDGAENYNMIAKKAGTYTFTYDPATQELKIDFQE